MHEKDWKYTMSLFETGIRPAIDKHLLKLAEERRDYGEYWPASSAGYCMRRVIFDRLQVPYVKEDARKQRIFEAGHVFHEWIQRITRDAGLSIAQELELQDESLMVRGHIDDLVLVTESISGREFVGGRTVVPLFPKQHLILYDYKTQNSRAFSYQKDRPMSHFHKMQVGTYMYMLRRARDKWVSTTGRLPKPENVDEARVLKISKDDLRMSEQQLLWTPELEKEVVQYWTTLSGYWKAKKLPRCTCHEHEGGFLAREAYNPYFYEKEPCSIKWLLECTKNKKINADEWTAEL